ncbi:hypothetical protein Moror_13493 [Moniliophthora roreri MCA 2997]|uniref:Uncharacterized protein n=1 Tax=Moniliophthora roreri (strain MCA 2997) TaxID=1381753 RepID=V2WUH5_MONRO|nr:hypothetical protein Moror_13493 [Moniliophthora roreri MCA 2997]
MNSTEHSKYKQANIRKQMVRGFTGALIVAGISLYVAKRIIDNRRKAELEIYRSIQRSEGQKAKEASNTWEPWFTPAACTNDAKRRDIQKLSLLAPK